MLAIVVSRADEASVAIGEELRAIAEWERTRDESRPDGDGGGTVYRTDGAVVRTFDDRHLYLERPVEAFDEPDSVDLLAFASKHAGETGSLLTAHHTGNFGPADHGGEPDALARASPNALATVVDRLDRYAPEGYDVGLECTHHGPTDVGAPSLFVEVGSGPAQWADDAAARAVARAILDLRDVPADRSPEGPDDGADGPDDEADGPDDGADDLDDSANDPDELPVGGDATRRHLVGFGGGHYAPRFERIVRETDWAVGHVAADWGLDAMADPDSAPGRDLIDAAFAQSAAAYALVAGDRPALRETVADLDYRPVGETWVRETDGVPLGLVRRLEADVARVDEGLRFGRVAREDPDAAGDYVVDDLPADLLDVARGIDLDATRALVEGATVAYATDQSGTRPTATVALAGASSREDVLDGLATVLEQRYDDVTREGAGTGADAEGDAVLVARETVFDPERAATLGVPEGPKFGRLAAGEPVEVDGRTIPPEEVRETRTDRFNLR